MSLIFGLNNRIDVAAVTSDAASWVSTLPLTNLQSPRLAEVARTTDLSFTLTIDLSAKAARGIGCVAIAGHNLSATAQVQIVTSQGVTQKDDSGVLSPWMYLSADDPHWDTHSYSAAIIDSERLAELTPTLIYFLPTNKMANKVVITITDTSNPDNYIEIGRVFVGEQMGFEMGEEYGDAAYGLIDFSEIQITKRRARYAYEYPRLRTLIVGFNHLTRGEALGGLRSAQLRAGLMGEVITAEGIPTYTTISGSKCVDSNWFINAFFGYFTEFDGLRNPYFSAYSMPVSIEEAAK